MKVNRKQLAAWAGMIGSALFVVTFTIEGWLRPGYNPTSMFVSELSLGPRGWIQIVNFVVFGVLFLVFTQGVAAEFKDGKASKAGPILLTIIGISLLVSGPLVMDPVTTPRSEWTWHGTLHQLFGALVFSLSPISVRVFLRRFWSDPQWQSLRWWTLVVAILTITAVIVLRVGPTTPPAPPNAINAWNGFIQRMILIPYFSWIFTFAYALDRRNKQNAE
jgi:hypothetical protein